MWIKERKDIKKLYSKSWSCLFFYDKGMYLSKRYQELILEMKARGMKPNSKRIFPDDIFTSELFNDWKPNDKDFDIIRERIAERIKKRPGWYRKTKIF